MLLFGLSLTMETELRIIACSIYILLITLELVCHTQGVGPNLLGTFSSVDVLLLLALPARSR